MVLAVTPVPRRQIFVQRLARGISPLTIALGATHAALVGQKREKETVAQKRAQLMMLSRCLLHVTESVPPGAFTIVDPAALDPAERTACPFTAKTLVVHPDDLDRAIGHFTARGDA